MDRALCTLSFKLTLIFSNVHVQQPSLYELTLLSVRSQALQGTMNLLKSAIRFGSSHVLRLLTMNIAQGLCFACKDNCLCHHSTSRSHFFLMTGRSMVHLMASTSLSV